MITAHLLKVHHCFCAGCIHFKSDWLAQIALWIKDTVEPELARVRLYKLNQMNLGLPLSKQEYNLTQHRVHGIVI
jgi:hypothetical protein